MTTLGNSGFAGLCAARLGNTSRPMDEAVGGAGEGLVTGVWHLYRMGSGSTPASFCTWMALGIAGFRGGYMESGTPLVERSSEAVAIGGN